MFRLLTEASVRLVRQYLPSPFVFVVILTLLAFTAAVSFTNQSFMQATSFWGNGLWSLLGFSMQMALILATGHVLAKAPFLARLLDNLASKVKSPKMAIVVVTLVALLGCWLNWGFGLIVGAVMAKALARNVKGADYPLLVASAYSGFLIWHGGLSGSIPLALATGGADLARISAQTILEAVPVSETLFSWYNLTIIAGLVIGLPLLNMAMMPKTPFEVDPKLMAEEALETPPKDTWAQRVDDNRILALILFLFGAMYVYGHFSSKGFSLTLNIVIAMFLFLGIFAHGTLERYSRAMEDSAKGLSGIILLFPFYGGIMGLMMGAAEGGQSLGALISNLFVSWSSTETFPSLAFLSAGLVNIFVPSGGGQWAVQGPIMLPAGVQLGVSPVVSAMAIAWGDAWTNMIQPFWALPLLGLAGLNARAIMGYCLIALIYSGILITTVFYFA